MVQGGEEVFLQMARDLECNYTDQCLIRGLISSSSAAKSLREELPEVLARFSRSLQILHVFSLWLREAMAFVIFFFCMTFVATAVYWALFAHLLLWHCAASLLAVFWNKTD